MVELVGPAPEEMKPGELYRVVQKHGKFKLEKVLGPKQKEKEEELFDIEFQLSPIRFHVACIQAFKEGMTYDRWLAKTVEELLDQICEDGPSKY